jgi:DNA-binding response OmpR family regulator
VAGAFSALRILIVEDEYYLAADLAEALRGQGADVVGPVGTLVEAAEMVERERIDCAILDMNLRGDMAYPIADRLEQAGIPFLIATGYNGASLPKRFSNVPRVEKPFNPSEVAAAIPGLLVRG